MDLTQGQMLFYGGIAGAAASLLALFISILVLEGKKKKLLKKLEEE